MSFRPDPTAHADGRGSELRQTRGAMPTEDPALLELLAKALELRDSGQPVVVADLCLARPDLAGQLAEALGIAASVGEIRDRSQGIDPRLGQVLARRYRLEQRLGAGAMGVVYRATDLELKRAVAIKLLQSDLFSAPEASARFLREAEVLAAVRHRSVVTVYDRGAVGDGPMFVAMELLDGAPLATLLDLAGERVAAEAGDQGDWLRDALGAAAELDGSYLRQVVRWAADLAAGLHAAHQAGVFHRDVKPSNVFIRRDGSAVLLDFGVAARSSEHTLAQRDAAIGTPAYMAPEQLRGGVAPAATLDVYGLCAALYHMLVLRPPYTGTVSEVMARLQRHDPEPAFRLRPGLPRDLQAILDRGMAREPGQRYPTAAALEADLRAFLAYQPVVARPLGRFGRIWRRARRSSEVRVAVLLLAAGAVAIGVQQWRAAQARAEQAARVARGLLWKQSYARLPHGLNVSNKAHRALAEGEERTALAQMLDRLVDQADAAIPSRLLRGSFRWDQGELDAARADLSAVASELSPQLGAAMLQRYTAASAPGIDAVDLAGLPDPVTPVDHYVVGYHELRGRKGATLARARQCLELAANAGVLPAQELMLSMLLIDAGAANQSEAQRHRAHGVVHEQAVRFESAFGERTCSVAHVMGAALLGQGRYAEAAELLTAALEVWPMGKAALINLATARRRIGDLDGAEQAARAAIVWRATNFEPWETLVLTLIDSGKLDAAREAAADAPAGAHRSRHAALLGYVEFFAALELKASGAAAETCQRALDQARAALERAAEAGSRQVQSHLAVCRALAGERPDEAFVGFLGVMAQDPLHWRRLLTMLDLMPVELDEAQTRALRDYFTELVTALAPKGESATAPEPVRPSRSPAKK